MRLVYGAGRAVFGGFFLYNGINHLRNAAALEGYAAAKKLPNPHLSVVGSGVLLTAAGTGLVLGVAQKAAALGVAGFLAVASTKMHDFWNVEDPGQRQAEQIQFAKNVAMVGAALALLGASSEG